jgi:lysozyme
MDAVFKSRLKALIVSHEGLKNHPYTDTKGNITIGIGYNLTARGLPDSWINAQYDEDVTYFDKQLSLDYAWYPELCDARRMALIDMCFMGYKTFQTFHKLILALELRNYDRAAHEMLNSEWAEQVRGRALELAEIMRSGELCSSQVA